MESLPPLHKNFCLDGFLVIPPRLKTSWDGLRVKLLIKGGPLGLPRYRGDTHVDRSKRRRARVEVVLTIEITTTGISTTDNSGRLM